MKTNVQTRGSALGNALLCVAVGLLGSASACSGTDAGAMGMGIPTPGEPGGSPSIPPAGSTGCPVPMIPDAPFSASKQTVGTGTAASCTEAALVSAVSAGGTVVFSCGSAPVVIALSAPLLPAKDLFLDGAGLVTLGSSGASRIIDMDKGGAKNLRLRDLRLSGGVTATNGGAILSSYRSNVYIERVTFDGNVAGAGGEDGGGALYLKSGSHGVVIGSTFARNKGGAGGAIHSLLSDLRMIDCSFQDNSSTSGASSGTQNGQPGGGYGGAVYIDGAAESGMSGEVQICGTRFLSNTAAGQGGAVFSFVYGQQVTIEASLFQGNSVGKNARNDALGGALRHGNGPLKLLRSTFISNTSADQGGALWVGENAQVTTENLTFFTNRAATLGGALLLASGNVLLRSATIVKNEAGSEGGGIFGDSRVTLAASLIANNAAQNQFGIKNNCGKGGNLGNDPAPILQGSGNLEWPLITSRYNNPYCTAQELNQDPLLAAMPADNGGPVPTLALLPGSPAIDAATGCATTDARGKSRQGACDFGAFELTP